MNKIETFINTVHVATKYKAKSIGRFKIHINKQLTPYTTYLAVTSSGGLEKKSLKVDPEQENLEENLEDHLLLLVAKT